MQQMGQLAVNVVLADTDKRDRRILVRKVLEAWSDYSAELSLSGGVDNTAQVSSRIVEIVAEEAAVMGLISFQMMDGTTPVFILHSPELSRQDSVLRVRALDDQKTRAQKMLMVLTEVSSLMESIAAESDEDKPPVMEFKSIENMITLMLILYPGGVDEYWEEVDHFREQLGIDEADIAPSSLLTADLLQTLISQDTSER